VAGALIGAEPGVQRLVDGAVDVDVDPLAGRAVLRPHLDRVAAVGGAVGLGDVAAEPGLLTVREVAAADALEEVAGADELAGVDEDRDPAGEGAVGEDLRGAAGGGEYPVGDGAAGAGRAIIWAPPAVLGAPLVRGVATP
jgi:hypothetical protein